MATKHVAFQNKAILQTALMGLAAYMTIETLRTQKKLGFLEGVRTLAANPWGVFTFKDFYANTLLMSLWTLARERNWMKAAAWITSYMTLGRIGTLVYVIKALAQLPPAARPARILATR